MDAERDHRPFFVPVHAGASGTLALRTGRLASGQRTGLAFTSQELLISALGPRQQWARLCEQALRDMLTPLGVHHISVDPRPIPGVVRAAPADTSRAHDDSNASGRGPRLPG